MVKDYRAKENYEGSTGSLVQKAKQCQKEVVTGFQTIFFAHLNEYIISRSFIEAVKFN